MDFFKQSMRLFRSVFPTIHHIRYKLSRKPYFIIDIEEGNYIDPNRKKKLKCMKRYNEKWLKTENFNMKLEVFRFQPFFENGKLQYEISNFAHPGYESKHNLTYWNNDFYYGFGAGAHGYLPGKR